jgi:hypothetical protein
VGYAERVEGTSSNIVTHAGHASRSRALTRTNALRMLWDPSARSANKTSSTQLSPQSSSSVGTPSIVNVSESSQSTSTTVPSATRAFAICGSTTKTLTQRLRAPPCQRSFLKGKYAYSAMTAINDLMQGSMSSVPSAASVIAITLDCCDFAISVHTSIFIQ